MSDRAPGRPRARDDDPGIFEIIDTTRAVRRLKPDPIPDRLVRRILSAAVAAPSAGDRQAWRFIVVKDRFTKTEVQAYYVRALQELYPEGVPSVAPPAASQAERRRARMMAAVVHLAQQFAEAPVWIVPCALGAPDRNTYATIYPAVQNMLLAARAVGLGAVLTTRHMAYGTEVDAILGLPADAHSYAIIPLGYPAVPFGPVRRRALAEVVYSDRWGAPWDSA